MRKRSSIVRKLSCVALAMVAIVTAFFYAPMDVEAEESVNADAVILNKEDDLYSEISTLSVEASTSASSRYVARFAGTEDVLYDFSSYLTDGDGLYEVTYNVSATFSSSVACTWYNPTLFMNCSGLYQQISKHTSGSSTTTSFTWSETGRKSYIYSDDCNMKFSYKGVAIWTSNPGTVTLSGSYSLTNIVATKVNTSDSDDYQNGYNAGYSAGEQSGYDNGYSQGFADGEASVDTDAIYDEAFQAGKDSVDTQSYYDAGYQAGYQVAYSEGYESGYDEGYQSAMERIASWGADTAVYPILLDSGSSSQVAFEHLLGEDYCFPFDYHCFSSWYGIDNFNVDANHTYKFEFWFDSISEYDDDWVTYSDLQLFANIGGCKYPLSLFKSGEDNKISIYISGDRMSDSMSFEAVFYGVCNLKADSHIGFIQLVINNLNVAYYDMGPSGDTQNHIANQTDKLTNGYDDSNGNSVNSDFSASLDDYTTSEDSLWGTATSNLESFAFFDLSTVPLVVTGISFVTSIMSGWFEQSGGADGVGIVLSILFSVMLVSMALGLYRLYQSQGHRQGKSGSSKGGKK